MQTVNCPEKQPFQIHSLTHLFEMNMHGSYTYLMYSKYLLFYKFLKNLGYYVHAQAACTRPGDKARKRPCMRQ